MAWHKIVLEEGEELEQFLGPSIDSRNKKMLSTVQNSAPFARKDHSLIKSGHPHCAHATKDGTDWSTQMLILLEYIAIPNIQVVLRLLLQANIVPKWNVPIYIRAKYKLYASKRRILRYVNFSHNIDLRYLRERKIGKILFEQTRPHCQKQKSGFFSVSMQVCLAFLEKRNTTYIWWKTGWNKLTGHAKQRYTANTMQHPKTAVHNHRVNQKFTYTFTCNVFV